MEIRKANFEQIRIMRENCKRLRTALGLSINELSKLTGIEAKSLMAIEKNQKEIEVKTLFTLSHFYGIPCQAIFIDIWEQQ